MEAPQQSGDTWVFLWDLWWVKHAALRLTNPFHTDYLFYPQGTDLYLHALNFINGLLSIPLQLATGEVILSWNILSLVLLAVSGIGAFAVVRRLTGNNLAALFSGYAFAFAPPTLMHLQGGQWNISSTWPIPFVVLAMLRFGETKRIRDAALCAIAWSILTYNWIEFGLDAALLLALFFLFSSATYLRRKDHRSLFRLWTGGAVIALAWLLLTAPLLIGGLASAYGDHLPLPGGGEFWSADLLAFVTPSPLWGQGVFADGPGGSHLQPGTILGTWYLGILPLSLSAVALLFWKRAPAPVLFWSCTGLAFLVLSLGPALYVNGERQSLSLFGFSAPLPYEIYDELPVAGDRRIPARMAVFGIFAVAVLAGLGLDALMSRLRSRSAIMPPIIAAAALAILVFEFWNPPVHVSPLAETPAVRAIASEPGDFTVLSVPWGRATGHTVTGDSSGAYMTNYYQTLHGKRSFGGYIARGRDLEWVIAEPGLRYLACVTCVATPEPIDLDPTLVASVLRKYRVRYVLMHLRGPDGWDLAVYGDTFQLWDAYLRNVLRVTPVYQDSIIAVYKNDDVP